METFVSSGIMIKRAVLSSDVQREKSYLFAGGSSPEEEAVKIYSSGTVTSQAATISHAVITQGGNNSMYISSGGTANYTSAGSGGLIYIYDGGTANNTSVRNGWLTIFNGGTANSTAVFSGGILDIYEGGSADSTFVYSDAGLYVNWGGIARDTTINSGGRLYISEGGVHRGELTIDSNGASVSAGSGGIIDFTLAGRTASGGVLINDISRISGSPFYTITVSADQAPGTYKLAERASSFTGILSIGTETVHYGFITVNGADFVHNGITYSLARLEDSLTLTVKTAPVYPVITGETVYIPAGSSIESATVCDRGAIVLSAGGAANHTAIGSAGAVHVYSGGTAAWTTVSSTGYLGVGQGGSACDTTIGTSGQFTVWGGTVRSNTVHGVFILSSGALAEETKVCSLGGLHVYSRSIASNTTIKEGGFLGVGCGAAVFGTTLDPFGKATLWGGASACNTSIGNAAVMTVLSRGSTDTSIICSGGVMILSSGATGNSSTILAGGGYQIGNGAIAYTTIVTSGAQLDIGSGATVYSMDVHTGADAVFSEGAILRGWSNLAGSITVNGSVTAAKAKINFDLTDWSASQGVILSNASDISGASYFVSVDASLAAGRYYLAGNAENIRKLTITGTSESMITGGDELTLAGNTYKLGLDADNTLYLDIARAAVGNNEEDWNDSGLGIWDGMETGTAVPLAGGEERKKENGLLAAN